VIITDEKLPGYMTTASTIECGLIHTGLPSCCVAFFIDVWCATSPLDPDMMAHRKKIDKLRPGYVPCPRCIKRPTRLVKPKACACPWHFEAGRKFEQQIQSGVLKHVSGNGYEVTDMEKFTS